MPYIDIVEPGAATGMLGELYTQIAKARGGIADIHKVQSLNPRAMAAHLDLYKAIMFQPGPLPRQWREAIAVAVLRAKLVLATGLAVEPDFEKTCRPTMDDDSPDQDTRR